MTDRGIELGRARPISLYGDDALATKLRAIAVALGRSPTPPASTPEGSILAGRAEPVVITDLQSTTNLAVYLGEIATGLEDIVNSITELAAGAFPSNLTATGNVIYLGVTGASDSNTGLDKSAPKATLAGALAACVSGQGDVIVVLPGTYTFTAQVAVDKAGVKILGWDYLLGSGKLSSIFAGVVGGAYALSIEANNIEIAGINISNTFGIDLDTASVENISIHDCIFSNNFTSIRIGVNNTQTSVSIRGNIFITQDNGEAISIVDAALVSIVDNTFLAQNPTTDIVLSIGFDADQSCPNCFVNQNRFYLNALSNAIYRAGTSVDAFFSGNLFAGGCLAITVLADGGYQAVENYQATDAGGALVDATT